MIAGAYSEGWEKKINHDVRLDLIKKTPTTKRGGRTYPKARTLYRSRAPAGGGEERPKAVNQGGAISPKNLSKRRSAVQLNRVKSVLC
ncbi:hypothetical protein TNCV_3866841 [Trichonephila clavipes]|nr:hypothetical protein TNCV_3866841 [Trichonephila clavipes]